MAGQVYAIASGKGGVGKTTTAVNLGVVLRRADHTVALVDADLGMANLGQMLGVSGERTVHDVLSGAATVEDALVEEAPGFAALTGSDALTDYPDADPRNLGDVLGTLAESFDFVLVDTGAGMSFEDVLPLGLVDGVILVTSPDPAAFGDTRKTAELADLARGDIAGVVVTKAEDDTDAERVASAVGVDLLGVIPYDPTVRESTASGRPLEATDPDAPAAVAYRELASRLIDGSAEPVTRTPQDVEEASAADTAAGDVGSEPAAAGDREPDEPIPAGEGPEPAPDASAAESPSDEEAEVASETEPPEEPSDEEAEVTSETEPPEEPSGGEADDEPADEGPAPTAPPEPTAADSSADEPAEADEEDPLAEFEDDEPESTGGLLSRLGRLFR